MTVAVAASVLTLGTGAARCGAAAALVESEPPGPAGSVSFDIPQQPLIDALDMFGSQANLQVLYESALVTGRQSSPVIGSFTPDEALKQLLVGSNLMASYADDRSITLHPIVPISFGPETSGAAAGPRMVLQTLRVEAVPVPDYKAYDGLIALDLQKALRRNAKTRHGDYTVGAKLWIGSGGAVERAELTFSSGDRERDGEIFRTLRNLVVSREPPADLPEPVTVSIAVKPL